MPIDFVVEAHANPALVTNIKRHEKALEIGADQNGLALIGNTVTVTGAILLTCAIAVLVYGLVTSPRGAKTQISFQQQANGRASRILLPQPMLVDIRRPPRGWSRETFADAAAGARDPPLWRVKP